MNGWCERFTVLTTIKTGDTREKTAADEILLTIPDTPKLSGDHSI